MNPSPISRKTFLFICACLVAAVQLVADRSAPAAMAVEPIQFEKETLDNGLRVIYAPMHQAPVVHVRVLYHVGSRDESADRQGFAHMFEHMMFRGSTHVAPEQHMKMIGVVGGDSNAFTSFDQTTYVNTIPSNAVEMALYLEADRMASFKVNDQIFQTERKVVSEEWRMRTANPPYGTMDQDLFGTAFTTHSYHWTPIGDMDQLRQASSSELQKFFNTYYIPNNACLVVAGDIDIPQTKTWVKKYFGWIPRGAEIVRKAKPEPEQKEPRRLVANKANVPLTRIYLAFKTVDYRSDDHYELSVLGDILSSGRTGRLDRQFVNGANPTCQTVGAGDEQLEDQCLFEVEANVQQGKDADAVEKDILAALYDTAEKGVTAEELDKVRTQTRQSLIRGRQTCTQIATELGQEEVFGGDAARVNEVLAKLDAMTPQAVQTVAKKYLKPEHLTVIQYRPGAAEGGAPPAAAKAGDAPVVASSEVVQPRVTQFPDGYPTSPPVNNSPIKATFNKGIETSAAGIKVITLTDHRLPLVNVSLIMPGGSDSETSDKIGLGGVTAQMMNRGSAGMKFLDFANDLESKGISISAADASDTTRILISCTTDQLDHAIQRGNEFLTKPMFPADEFNKFKTQWIGGLRQSLANPTSVAGRELTHALYSGGILSRVTTQKTLEAIQLDDVKKWYEKFFQLEGAFMVISGDVSPEQGTQIAEKLVAGLDRRATPAEPNYGMWSMIADRHILLVDNPEGRQATIRLGIRAYDVHSDEKYAGGVAGQILSAGIEGRLNKYVRAEKGLTYGAYAYFRPSRHAGEFSGSVDTNPDTAGAAIEAVIKVFNDMRNANVTDQELAEAKTRTAGGMVMEMQTIAQQAGRRIDQILNGYPLDYWDQYPSKVAEVTAAQVKQVMNSYVTPDDRMIFVVVAPALVVKDQLEKEGDLQVMPMPLKREEH